MELSIMSTDIHERARNAQHDPGTWWITHVCQRLSGMKHFVEMRIFLHTTIKLQF